MDHVTSQLPYALSVAAAAATGYVVLGMTKSAWLGFAVTGVVLAVLALVLRKKQNASVAA